MNIAFLGATSQIAKDLIIDFSQHEHYRLSLFSRRPQEVSKWLENNNLDSHCSSLSYVDFNENVEYEAIINFVGVGDPALAAAMGSSIFEVTLHYDEMALEYLKVHPNCRYLFLSSGAVYGSKFEVPVDENSKSIIDINNIQPQDWYGVAKLYAECRHRALSSSSIIDIRVFNYISRTHNIDARFLVTDMLRAIRDRTMLQTSPEYIVRDYLHPSDFYRLVTALLTSPATNTAIDCYTKGPIDKPTLLATMQREFGLRYQITDAKASLNPTGSKPYYYSENRRAAEFGYTPELSSLKGVLMEMSAMLNFIGHLENEN